MNQDRSPSLGHRPRGLRWLFCCVFGVVLMMAAPGWAQGGRVLLLVEGAAGEAQYGAEFRTWAERWEQAAQQGGLKVISIGRDPTTTAQTPSTPDDLNRLQELLRHAATEPPAELWIVLLGHGTFDKRTAKFNLRGPDLSAAQLNQWLAPIKSPIVIINCSACSGAFLPVLSQPGRVVLTSTKSGDEQNFSRYGDWLSRVICSPQADLNKDLQTSLAEAAFLAARQTTDFYAAQDQLQTEFPLLDDDGDGRGTRPELLARPGQRATAGISDGALSARRWVVRSSAEDVLTPTQRLRREVLMRQIAELRTRRPEPVDDAYWDALETLLMELARLETGAATEQAAPEGSP